MIKVKYSGKKGKVGSLGCGIVLAVAAINMAIGGVATQYVLWYFLNRNVHWFADGLIGLVGGQFLIPLSIICWILNFCGVGPLH